MDTTVDIEPQPEPKVTIADTSANGEEQAISDSVQDMAPEMASDYDPSGYRARQQYIC